MYKIEIPENVKLILQIIEKEGFEACVVGGSIRNQLINQIHKTDYKIKDWDIATNADYDLLSELFKDYKPKTVGKQFGVLMIEVNEEMYELAQYRVDGSYSDGRRPDDIKLTRDLKEDCARRDFKMNAIAYSLKDGIIDHFDGIEDIKNKVISCVGVPERRLTEDKLRIIRGIRFASQYGFIIEQETKKTMYHQSKNISEIANERIQIEFDKIIVSDFFKHGMELMACTGLLEQIFPELYDCFGYTHSQSNLDGDLFDHLISTVEIAPKDLTTRLACLFHDIAKVKVAETDNDGITRFPKHDKISSEMSVEILTRLRYGKQIIEDVSKLISRHMNKSSIISDKAVKKLMIKVGEHNIDRLLDLMKADIKSHSKPHNFESLDDLSLRIKNILENNEPIEKSQMEINGKDVMKLGIERGKKVGEVLEYCMDLILEDPSLNNKDKLSKIIVDKFM